MWKVLSGEGENGWGVLREDGDEISGRSLVTIGWSPESDVRGSSEPCGSLDRLVGRSVLTETNRVVSSDLNDSEVGESGKSDSTGSVRDEVEESSTEWDDTTVGSETVTDGSHTVFSNTESEVSTSVRTETGGWVLEILGTLPSGQVGTGQIGGTTNELWKNLDKLGNGGFGKLSATNSGILGGVGGECLLPSIWKTTFNSSSEFGSLLGVLVLVLLEESIPLLGLLVTLLSGLAVDVFGDIGNDKGLVGVEAPLLLKLSDIVLLEGYILSKNPFHP